VNASVKLVGFAAAVAAALGLGLAVGHAVGPFDSSDERAPVTEHQGEQDGHGS
jgi:hypothetical protein